MYLSILQRNLAIFYCAQQYQAIPTEWTFGISFNVHRLPLDQSGEPQAQTGMNLAHGTEVLHQSMWGFIYQISVLTPPDGPVWGWLVELQSHEQDQLLCCGQVHCREH